VVNKRKEVFQILKKTAIGVFVLIGLHLLRQHFLSLAVVHGNSMNPTFSEGDLILVGKWEKTQRVGDVIVFEKSDGTRNRKFIKRLIAKGNSEVFIENFQVIVNGAPFRDSADNPPVWDRDQFACRFSEVFQLRSNEIFVLGDNRCQSADSRFLDSILESEVTGKVLMRVLPSRWNWMFQFSQRLF
jgi:signal peptidase I